MAFVFSSVHYGIHGLYSDSCKYYGICGSYGVYMGVLWYLGFL